MLVEELMHLADWLEANVLLNNSEFSSLVSVLHHNSTQSSKQPILQLVDAASSFLQKMRLEQLTASEIDMLKKINIYRYLGENGVRELEGIIKVNDYDPATAYNAVQSFGNAIESNARALVSLRDMLSVYHFKPQISYPDQKVLCRIRFINDASINTILDLEKRADDWKLIARGMAELANERIEDIKVVGASTGSVVIWITSSIAIAKLLALLSKYVNISVQNSVDAMSAIEGLRHTKIMNKQIEDLIKAEVEKKKSGSQTEVVDKLIEYAGGATPETKSKVAKSVEKYIDFSERGGELDMIAPPKVDDADVAENLSDSIAELRSIIEEDRKLIEKNRKFLGKIDKDS